MNNVPVSRPAAIGAFPHSGVTSSVGSSCRRVFMRVGRDVGKLDDGKWDDLIGRIKDGRCTPLIGAGASANHLPLGREIAEEWATEYDYPMPDPGNLPRVAQYVAVTRDDHVAPKEWIARAFKAVPTPDFTDPKNPHTVLASMPFETYITTNYDGFMAEALRTAARVPTVEMCGWNRSVRDEISDPDSDFYSSGNRPTADNPLVFHLHGSLELPESLVLTEDDYIDFLVSLARSENMSLLSARVQKALTRNAVLFVGYSLSDWTFRVIFRGLVVGMQPGEMRPSVAVQLEMDDEETLKYMTEYFGESNLHVYWGTAADFTAELSRRWAAESPA